MKNNFFAFIVLVNCLSGFSQMNKYKYSSKIENPSSIWHKITLDETVFDKINPNFSDIRIFHIKENDTIETPYYIENLTKRYEETLKDFVIINSSRKKNNFYYTLKRDSNIEISSINLDFGKTNFDWKITLEGSNNQNEWFEIINNQRIVAIKNSETNFSFTKLNFPSSNFIFFRIIIEEENSPELKLAQYSNYENAKLVLEPIKCSNVQINQDKINKRTIISANFDFNTPISNIKIKTNSSFDFNRPLIIILSQDSINLDETYDCLTFPSYYFNSFNENSFDFEQNFTKFINIVIENNDNQMVNIEGVDFYRNPVNIISRFESNGNFFLCFGNENDLFPKYDIEQFSDKIPKNISTLNYQNVKEINQKIKNVKTNDSKNNWIWIIISVIIILLIYFTFKMMTSKSLEE